jgi:nucleoid-associated protein YgaU
MSTNHPPTPLVDERYRDALERFRQLEHDLQQERETIATANAERLEARQQGIRERVDELERAHDKILALGEAIASHPDVRGLEEATASLPVSTHDADPDVVFEETLARHEAAVAALLPDLELTHVDVPSADTADPTPSAAPPPSFDEDADPPAEDATERTCVHCGAAVPEEAETCPACGGRLRLTTTGDGGGGSSENATQSGCSGCGGCAWVVVLIVLAGVAGIAALNAGAALPRSALWVCDVPGINTLVYDCERILNPPSYRPPPPPGSTPPAPTRRVHTVARGETLSQIASRYGTTWQNLASINGIRDPNQIEVGDVIRLE